MSYKNEIINGVYKLKIASDDVNTGIIEFALYDSRIEPPYVLFLELSPLGKLEDEFKEQMRHYSLGILRDKDELNRFQIVQLQFGKGDFFQSSVERYDRTYRISYLTKVHEMLILNKEILKFIKNIYSTSKKMYAWEKYITPDAVNFWEKQIQKGDPYFYYENDDRYLLRLNH